MHSVSKVEMSGRKKIRKLDGEKKRKGKRGGKKRGMKKGREKLERKI